MGNIRTMVIMVTLFAALAAVFCQAHQDGSNNQAHGSYQGQLRFRRSSDNGVDHSVQENEHKEIDENGDDQSEKNNKAQKGNENLLILTTRSTNQDGQAVVEAQINQNQQEQEAQAQTNQNNKEVDQPGDEGLNEDDQGTKTTRNPYEPVWTTCNFTVDPILSCADCKTRVICKPIGALVKPCYNPYRPYCFNGICSPVPSPECVRPF